MVTGVSGRRSATHCTSDCANRRQLRACWSSTPPLDSSEAGSRALATWTTSLMTCPSSLANTSCSCPAKACTSLAEICNMFAVPAVGCMLLAATARSRFCRPALGQLATLASRSPPTHQTQPIALRMQTHPASRLTHAHLQSQLDPRALEPTHALSDTHLQHALQVLGSLKTAVGARTGFLNRCPLEITLLSLRTVRAHCLYPVCTLPLVCRMLLTSGGPAQGAGLSLRGGARDCRSPRPTAVLPGALIAPAFGMPLVAWSVEWLHECGLQAR